MRSRKALANAARSVLRSIGFRSVTRTVYGEQLRIPIAVGELKSLLLNPLYPPLFEGEELMELLVGKMRPTDVVFDVGAWHGINASLFSRRASQVVSFEPNPSTFRVLQETIVVNGARNITAYALAVGNERATAELWGTGSGSSLRPGPGKLVHSLVNVISMDEFAAERSTLPDVIKIDAEGAEYQVLAGARDCLAHTRLLYLEMHFLELPKFDASPAMLESLVRAAGFVEIGRQTPVIKGAEDRTRLHLLFEKG